MKAGQTDSARISQHMLLTVLWYAKDELDIVLLKDFTIWRGWKTDDSEILHVMREEIQVCAECWGSPEEVEHRSRLWGRRVPSNQLQVVEIQPKTASFPVLIPDGGEGMRGFISSLYALLLCLHFVPFRAYFMTNSETLWKATPTNSPCRICPGATLHFCPIQISGAALAGHLPLAPLETRDPALVFLLDR